MHEQTHLLGGQKGVPLMLLPSAAAAEEACNLLLGSSSAVAAAPIRAAASASSPPFFLLDLGCWLEAVCPVSNHALSASSSSRPPALPAPDTHLLSMGLRLLCHSIRHCLPGCATAIMDILSTRLGITPEELLHSVTMLGPSMGLPTGGDSRSIDPPNLSLLHLAMLRGNLPLIHSLLAWAELHSVRPDWTVAGPSGICPLHLAALLPNAEAVVRGMLELPRPYGPDIAAAWLLCRSSDGRTPAELGSSVGLPASLDSQAHDVLVRAAEEEPSFEVGANPGSVARSVSLGSVARSVSLGSGFSGIATMMESILTEDEGFGGGGVTSQWLATEEGTPTSPQPQTSARGSVAPRVSSGSGSSRDKKSNSFSVRQHLHFVDDDDVDDPPPSSCWLDLGGGGGEECSSSAVRFGARKSRPAPVAAAAGGMAAAAESAALDPRPQGGDLSRLLLRGFRDAETEARYAEFKVRQSQGVQGRGRAMGSGGKGRMGW